MPFAEVASGLMVSIDDEDLELLDGCTWSMWRRNTREKIVIINDVMAGRRLYRRTLHREVAFRMRPDLLDKADIVRVTVSNGNFTDVRRDNIEIAVRPRKRGRVKRPRGARKGKLSNPAKRQPPAWSADGHRNATRGIPGEVGCEADGPDGWGGRQGEPAPVDQGTGSGA